MTRFTSRLVTLLLTSMLSTGVWYAGGSVEAAESGTLVAVHTTPVRQMTLHRHLMLYGHVVPEPASAGQAAASVQISAAEPGLVTRIATVEGATLNHGDLLCQLDTRAADASIQRRLADLKLAKTRFKRQQDLAKLEDTSRKNLEQAEQQYEQARAALKQARIRRSLLDIRSTLDATVSRILVQKGEFVSAGTPVAELIDPDRLTAQLRVPASQLAVIHPGQTAIVESSGTSVEGTVNYVGVRIDPDSGTTVIRVTLPEPDGLRAGQFIRARIITRTRPDVLAVPVNAVVRREDKTGFIAVVRDNQAELMPVTTGLEDGNWIEISGSNIHEGIVVVSREAYGLPERTRVTTIDDNAIKKQ